MFLENAIVIGIFMISNREDFSSFLKINILNGKIGSYLVSGRIAGKNCIPINRTTPTA
ncbi:hypothetical protein GW830_03850 [bacterium]|nr:hypothetical protein [bacterium]